MEFGLATKTLKALALAGILALGACGNGGDDGGQAAGGDRDWGNFGQEEGDVVIGDPDAPISIVEYASVTCGHCAQFHVFTYPYLHEEYIEAGLARFVMRPLPTPPTNMARLGFMIASCMPEGRYYPFIDALMRTQNQWAFNQNPEFRIESLARLAAQAGLSREAFDACRIDQSRLDLVNAQTEASLAAGVQSTPTFFVNGEKIDGAMGWEQFEPYLIAHLPEDLRPSEEPAEEGETAPE